MTSLCVCVNSPIKLIVSTILFYLQTKYFSDKKRETAKINANKVISSTENLVINTNNSKLAESTLINVTCTNKITNSKKKLKFYTLEKEQSALYSELKFKIRILKGIIIIDKQLLENLINDFDNCIFQNNKSINFFKISLNHILDKLQSMTIILDSFNKIGLLYILFQLTLRVVF